MPKEERYAGLVFWEYRGGQNVYLGDRPRLTECHRCCRAWFSQCFVFTLSFPLFLSRKFLKSLIRKQPQELLLVIGTGVSAAVAPGIPALCSWRSCIEAVIEAAEQLEVLHPGDVAEFRRKVTKDRDLLVVAHDLIRKMSPVSLRNSSSFAGQLWVLGHVG